MNFALTLSAILGSPAQRSSAFKAIRDPTLSALTMDLSEVIHDERARNPCNTVTLSKEDRGLGRLNEKEASIVASLFGPVQGLRESILQSC